MSRSLRGVPVLAVVGCVCVASLGRAQLAERLSVEQHGDVVLIGNTLAQNCADEVPEPVVGTVGACGSDADDSGADVLWSLGDDGQGPPLANLSVSPAEAASIAVLALPEGASVTHARLYWSAPAGDGDRTLATLSASGESLDVDAEAADTVSVEDLDYYQASADVTAFVQATGAGAYRVGGIDVADPDGLDDPSYYAAWWLAVFYSLATEPVRHLGLYDGLERVSESTSVTLSGFEVAPGSVDARLGVVGYDGDGTLDGDQLLVGPDLGSTEAVGPANNFFDGSRRAASGDPRAAPGDLPETLGTPDSLSGLDLHVVDVAAAFAPGQTSAEVVAATDNDQFFFSGLVLSVGTTAPDLALSTESVRDVNGPPLRPGDELEYSIEVNNSGTGAAPRVTIRAALPASVRFVPGSLALGVGADAGATLLTDAADGDGGELEPGAGEVLVMRFGTGDGASGGPLAVGETRPVRYRVTVAPDAVGSIVSQAELSAASDSGAVTSSVRSDSDLASPGVSPTEIVIDGCATDAECAGSSPRCDLSVAPTQCVACLSDADCSGLAPLCDAAHACVCQPSAADEVLCDGKDDDCDGQIDDGLAGVPCEVGIGICRAVGTLACDVGGGARCSAEPLAPQPELCGNGADDDCDGDTDGVDSDCAGAEPLAGAASGGLVPVQAEPSSERTPAASLMPAPADTSVTASEGAGVSFGGGASCHVGPAARPARGTGWLALAFGLVWAGRARARRGARAER